MQASSKYSSTSCSAGKIHDQSARLACCIPAQFYSCRAVQGGTAIVKGDKAIIKSLFYMCIIKRINVVNVRNVNQASYVNYIVKILAFEARLINYNC